MQLGADDDDIVEKKQRSEYLIDILNKINDFISSSYSTLEESDANDIFTEIQDIISELECVDDN